MLTTGAMAITMSLVAAAGDERLLLCRPAITGDAALARGDAVQLAARTFGTRFLDYGVACEDAAEAARAAQRAGLAHAVAASAEGRTDGSRYALALASAELEKTIAERTVVVAPGADATDPLRGALARLLAAVPARECPERAGPWVAMGTGAAAIVAGTAFALVARSSADARDRAGARGDWKGYVDNDARWRSWRTASGVGLGVGAAAIAAGAAWRFVF